jgi:hypothetical protein
MIPSPFLGRQDVRSLELDRRQPKTSPPFDNEERCVPAAAVATGMASTPASSESLAPSTPTLTPPLPVPAATVPSLTSERPLAGQRSGAWRKTLVISGIGLLVLVAALALLVTAYGPRLSALYREMVTTLAQVQSVQTALRQKYPTQQFEVQALRRSAGPRNVLRITVLDPQFLESIDLAGQSGKEKALEVATAARDALSSGRGYDQYEIAFERRWGVNVYAFLRYDYRFPATALPPPGSP